MLTLKRSPGQSVVIGSPLGPIGTVRVASISGKHVKLEFDFPVHIEVNRAELAERKSASPTQSVGMTQRPG
jgi:sRNA-binding carbon storage regulator CsrA